MTTEKWLKLVRYNPKAFGIEAGFKDLSEIHNDWLKSFLFSKDDFTLQAHRGSYKTTCLAIAIALIIVLYPSKNIIMVRKADDDVKEIVMQVKKILNSDMVKSLIWVLYRTELMLTTSSVYEIDTNLKTSPRGASQLVGLGSKTSITGKHADILITDDIININDRISQAERERTKLTYQELENVKNKGGRFINTGTPWHKEDAFVLMKNINRFDCYSTGILKPADIQDKREKMTPSLFAANYELKHIADEDTLFSSPVVDDGANTELIYDGICHVDASYGGGDNTAFTILKEQADGKIYVYGMLSEKHVDDCLEFIEGKRKLYRAGTLYLESNADKGYLAEKISTPINLYHESTNKYIKISTYLRERWRDIIFTADTDKEYINQVLDYSENAEHDDAPDSLASLLRAEKNKPKIKLFRNSI